MQQRVCVVLKQWIAVGYADFSGTFSPSPSIVVPANASLDLTHSSHTRHDTTRHDTTRHDTTRHDTHHCTHAVKMKSAMMAFVEGQLTSDYALVKETKELRTVLQYQMGNEAARNSLFIAVHIQPAPLRRRPSA
jgi:hypothetical protein